MCCDVGNHSNFYVVISIPDIVSVDISVVFFFFFFKQKTAYEIGTGDWSSDVCSSDLGKSPVG